MAVKVNKQIKTRPWYIEPALYTALGTAAFYALLLGFKVEEPEILTGILGAFLAIVFCTVFGNSTRQGLKNKYLQSEVVKAERAQGDKLVLQKVEAVETLVPEAELSSLKEEITEGTSGRTLFAEEKEVFYAFDGKEPVML